MDDTHPLNQKGNAKSQPVKTHKSHLTMIKADHDRRHKRLMDRKSGSDQTGVKPTGKRGGSGAHNWGNYRDDLDGQFETIDEAIDKDEEIRAGTGIVELDEQISTEGGGYYDDVEQTD